MAFAVRNNWEMQGHQHGALLLREAERTLAELANKGILVRALMQLAELEMESN